MRASWHPSSRDMAVSTEDGEFIERPDMARTEPKEVPCKTITYHTILDMGRTEEELGFIEQLSEASEQTGLAQSASCIVFSIIKS